MNPQASNDVYAIAVSGTTVYFREAFLNIGGQARSAIAAFETNTNNATAWNPNADGISYALAVRVDIFYSGGDFTNIGCHSRANIAELEVTTGNATTWNPGANLRVYTIFLTNAALSVGGDCSLESVSYPKPELPYLRCHQPQPHSHFSFLTSVTITTCLFSTRRNWWWLNAATLSKNLQ